MSDVCVEFEETELELFVWGIGVTTEWREARRREKFKGIWRGGEICLFRSRHSSSGPFSRRGGYLTLQVWSFVIRWFVYFLGGIEFT